MTKTKSFKCPSCGAPLEYEHLEALTVRCPFCSNSVIVPEELRRPGQFAQASTSPTQAQPTDPAQVRAAMRETRREARAKRKALRHQLREMRHR
jgi:uncharacterized Zn finger protein (UPF0148 family)